MGKKPREIPLQPFHLSIATEMDYLRPEHKNATVRVVAAAWMIATTACPKGREGVRGSLEIMLKRFGGKKSKRWTQASRAIFNHAFAALARQDKEETDRVAAHARSGVVADVVQRINSEAGQNVGVHS